MTKYGVIVGSLRKNSYTQGVAKAIVAGLPKEDSVTWLDIDLPLYDQDYDDVGPAPESYQTFRSQAKNQDAFILVTPEHNRNTSAALKNALDVGSRPMDQTVWDGKPALVASQSPSGIAGALANHAVRHSLVFLNMPVLQQPELYIGNSADLADKNGNITNADTQKFLADAAKKFVSFAKRFVSQQKV